MICPWCHGSGKRLNPRLHKEQIRDGMRVLGPWGEPLLVPCEECLGGVASCCDAAGALPLWDEFEEEA